MSPCKTILKMFCHLHATPVHPETIDSIAFSKLSMTEHSAYASSVISVVLATNENFHFKNLESNELDTRLGTATATVAFRVSVMLMSGMQSLAHVIHSRGMHGLHVDLPARTAC